ncbi:MAG: DUF1794, partial [uncultured Frankineae bacterium]
AGPLRRPRAARAARAAVVPGRHLARAGRRRLPDDRGRPLRAGGRLRARRAPVPGVLQPHLDPRRGRQPPAPERAGGGLVAAGPRAPRRRGDARAPHRHRRGLRRRGGLPQGRAAQRPRRPHGDRQGGLGAAPALRHRRGHRPGLRDRPRGGRPAAAAAPVGPALARGGPALL